MTAARWATLSVLAFATHVVTAQDARTLTTSPRQLPPNVWWIVLDDCDPELFEHPGRHTPNLDWLREHGVTFINAEAPISVCRPTLASFLVGREPHEHGIRRNGTLQSLSSRNALAKRLANVGYKTYLGGKFWEDDFGMLPRDYGFRITERIGNANEQTGDGLVRGGQEIFLELASSPGPWYALWQPALPHVPFDAPAHFVDLIDRDLIAPPAWIEPGDHAEYVDRTAGYLANLAWVDDGIGAGLQKLTAAGTLNRTLIIVVSDNGWALGSVSKGSPYRKGVTTPLTFSWLGTVRPGVRERVVGTARIPATIAEFCGAPPTPEDADRSLCDFILSDEDGDDVLCGASYARGEYPGAGIEPILARTAATKRWRYVRCVLNIDEAYEFNVNWWHLLVPHPTIPAKTEQLFDLSVDPWERIDVARDPANAAILAELRAAVDAWQP